MNKIKEYRERHELSQEELARRLGIDRSSVTKWENGSNTPRLAHLFNPPRVVSIGNLLYWRIAL